jgi:hypothetical protein
MRRKMNKKAIRKPQVKQSPQSAGRRDSRQAVVAMMGMTVEEFYSTQNHENPIMAELLRQSLKGNLRAAKRIMDIVEGKI